MSNWSEAVAALPLRIVCAWCQKVLSVGREPTSHSMCPGCIVRFEAGRLSKGGRSFVVPRGD